MSAATCVIPNCRKVAPPSEAFCSDHRDDRSATKNALLAALRPFAEIPLVYPRNGSAKQEAELESGDRGPYTAADVLCARAAITKATTP